MSNANDSKGGIVAAAAALQERDAFRAGGWLKVLAPAKVNLHLAIGARRDDGYHEAVSIMHAVNLHDVVYLRRKAPNSPGFGEGAPAVQMVSCGDVAVPELDPGDNIAARAVMRLARELRRPKRDADLEIRIEKNIPFEGGLGGGSTDAAAALVGAASLWGVPRDDDALERAARSLGADVAFFLHGGCSAYGGVGDEFVRALAPSKQAVVLVKPEGGVSTAQAYHAFDGNPAPVPEDAARRAREVRRAEDLDLFNNLAGASESLMPALSDVRTWLLRQPGVQDALLCGSGATTFARCDDFAAACRVVAAARREGWWARATSFGSVRAMVAPGGEA